MFLFEVLPGQVRLAFVIFREEKTSEIIVFLSRRDALMTDVTGDLTWTPRLYVSSDLLPEPESNTLIPVLSGGESLVAG